MDGTDFLILLAISYAFGFCHGTNRQIQKDEEPKPSGRLIRDKDGTYVIVREDAPVAAEKNRMEINELRRAYRKGGNLGGG